MPAEKRDLTGTVVAITGASSGIGAATARLLGEAGARVVLGAYMFVHGTQKLFGWFGHPPEEFHSDQIDPTLTAVGGVLSQYIPQLQYGKVKDPAATITEMRQKLKDAGFEDALTSIQADLDEWGKTHKAK